MSSIGDFGTPIIGSNGQVSFSGLETGLNTSQIIQALLTPYTDQVDSIQSEQKSYQTDISDYQTINSDVANFQSAAQALNLSSSWGAATATSSKPSVATATAANDTPQGTLSFTVGSLASSDSWVSSGTVATTGTVVDTNPSYLISQASSYGFSSLVAGAGLSVGAHSVDVTQALSAASTSSASILPSSVDITGANDTITMNVNGNPYTLTLANGTYTSQGSGPGSLANAIDQAAQSAGAAISASVSQGGYLTLATNLEGDGASLQVTGGTALATLGLSTMATAASGTAGSVTVDGTVNSIDNVNAGSSVVLNSGSGGTITATVGNGVGTQAGSFTATNVSTGSGSLANLVANINAANAGVVASAVQTGSGYILQLSSTQTGTGAAITDDQNAFSSSGLGTMDNSAPATDATVTVGGAYSVSSQTNTVSGLLPGLSVQLLSTSTSPVTVTVSANVQGLTNQVENLVNAANQVLSDVNQYAGYNASTKTAGPLLGQASLQALTQQILTAFGSTRGTSSLSPQQVGISVVYNSGTGQTTIQFNQSTFQSELQSNPSAVEALFAQGGSFKATSGLGSGTVNFVAATNNTEPGTYAVKITAPATQASDTGTNHAGTITSTETLNITEGAGQAAYTTSNGETYAQVVSGLNSAFAAAGLNLSASVNGSGQIAVASTTYGSTAGFTVSGATGAAGATGLSNGTFAGTNVAGTIDGVVANGSGQSLVAPESNKTLAGLSLQVTATAPGTGSLTYSPGIAQIAASLANTYSNPVSGALTTAINGLNTASTNLGNQITFYQNLSNQAQQALETQYSQLEATIGGLKTESSYISQALSSL